MWTYKIFHYFFTLFLIKKIGNTVKTTKILVSFATEWKNVFTKIKLIVFHNANNTLVLKITSSLVFATTAASVLSSKWLLSLFPFIELLLSNHARTFFKGSYCISSGTFSNVRSSFIHVISSFSCFNQIKQITNINNKEKQNLKLNLVGLRKYFWP